MTTTTSENDRDALLDKILGRDSSAEANASKTTGAYTDLGQPTELLVTTSLRFGLQVIQLGTTGAPPGQEMLITAGQARELAAVLTKTADAIDGDRSAGVHL